jgi:hypothetical protein
MKDQVVVRKISVIYVDQKTGESAQERRFVSILASILLAALALVVTFWR